MSNNTNEDGRDDSPSQGKKRRPSIPRGGALARIQHLANEIPIKADGTGLKASSSRFLNVGQQEHLERLELVKNLPLTEREAMFIRKVKQCSICFDFTKSINLAEPEQKEIKRETLLELVEFLLTEQMHFTPAIYKAVFAMVATNLFRPLPPRMNPTGAAFDAEDDEPILEAAWPHVQIVYEFFLRFVESPEFDAQVAKQFLHRNFITQMLDLFDSEDPRERDYLKTTLHRIYGKFLSLRSFIRRQIKFIFLTYCYENDSHNGIAELLEILGSIINGFTLPLKQEHKDFLIMALIPLHKPRAIATYHPQLSYCIAQYIEKDPSLTEIVFKKVLHYWPVTNSSKQLLFLSEIEEILCVVEPDQFIVVQEVLFRKIATAISSSHFQIAEKALTLWNNEYILSLVAENVETILPIVFPALYWDAKSHWNKAIRSMAYTAIRLFMDIDEVIFGRVIENYKNHREKEKSNRSKRVADWRSLFEQFDPEKLEVNHDLEPSLAPPTPSHLEVKQGPINPAPIISEHLDPLLSRNDNLPLSVKIPHHMNQLVSDDFDVNDPVFKELSDLHQLQVNKKLRRKEILPMPGVTLDAIQGHVSLDDMPGDYAGRNNYDSDSDDYSSSSYSGEYSNSASYDSDDSYEGAAGGESTAANGNNA